MMRSLATEIACAVDARLNCIKSGNTEWKGRWEDRLDLLCKNHLPSGSGWDHGTKLDLERSTGERLIFRGGWHHMDENGCYGPWTHHDIVVTPSLLFEFNVKVMGRDRNDIKEYLTGLFMEALQAPAPVPVVG